MFKSLLVLLTLSRQLAGAPVDHPITHLVPQDALSQVQSPSDICSDPTGRSIQTLVWSCFATIFACTWVAIHPNIPGPTDSRWSILKRGIVTMICALIAPELITTWALHQYIGARFMQQDYNKNILGLTDPPKLPVHKRFLQYFKDFFREKIIREPEEAVPWTKTHGFFLQMGGFMLYEKGKPVQVLTYRHLRHLIITGKIDKPDITVHTINDKGKSDHLSKLIVVVQTTWFVVQCAARWVTKLPLSELEVVTLAFALLNATTYALWFNKPQNVQESIKLHLKIDDSKGEGPNADNEKPDANKEGPDPNDEEPEPVNWLVSTLKNMVESPQAARPRVRRRISINYLTSGDSWAVRAWRLIFVLPWYIISCVFRPFLKLMLSGPLSTDPPNRNRLRVSIFSTEGRGDSSDILYRDIPCFISVLFGLVHLVAWSSVHTVADRWIWRASTITIIMYPPILSVAGILTNHINGYTWVIICLPVMLLSTPAYLVARVMLMTQALVSLRHLPAAAFCGIEWDSFIPHL